MERIRKLVVFMIALAGTLILMTVVASADTGIITGNGVNFRWSPSMKGGIISVLPKGTIVTTTGREGDWTKVTYSGTNGYVYSTYITIRANYADRNSLAVQRPEVSKGQQVADYAAQFLGTPYVYGGASPKGFDCSGLTSYVYKQFGVTLNRTAAGQNSNGTWVAKGDLQPGDIVLFRNGGKGIGHAGIYVGNGQMIHSVKPGVSVRYESIESGYYANNYVAGRRIF